MYLSNNFSYIHMKNSFTIISYRLQKIMFTGVISYYRLALNSRIFLETI